MEIRMRSNVCTLILAAASLAPSALLAQPLDLAARGATITATAPGTGVAERVAQITASVEAVDSAKRTVTLKGPPGDIVTLAARPHGQNFEQTPVGHHGRRRGGTAGGAWWSTRLLRPRCRRSRSVRTDSRPTTRLLRAPPMKAPILPSSCSPRWGRARA